MRRGGLLLSWGVTAWLQGLTESNRARRRNGHRGRHLPYWSRPDAPTLPMPETARTRVAGAEADARPTRQLRVLFLMTRDGRHPAAAGGDVGLWERALYLAERGHVVTVVAGGFSGAPRREFISGIEVIR